jgi:hypothetical protein
MNLKRGTLGLASVAILVMIGSLVVATYVTANPRVTRVTDQRGDGGAIDSGTDRSPGFCDIVKTTSKLAKRGRVRHTVTTVGPIKPTFNAPPVLITKHRIRGSIGLVPLVLVPGVEGVRTHFKNDHRTVIYYLKRRQIKRAVGRSDKYFWVADQSNCPIHDDMAPNHGSAVQKLKPRRHHHHR